MRNTSRFLFAAVLLAVPTAARAGEPAPVHAAPAAVPADAGALTLEASPAARGFRALVPAAAAADTPRRDATVRLLPARGQDAYDRELSDSFTLHDPARVRPEDADAPAAARRPAWSLAAPAANPSRPAPVSETATAWDFSVPVVAPASGASAFRLERLPAGNFGASTAPALVNGFAADPCAAPARPPALWTAAVSWPGEGADLAAAPAFGPARPAARVAAPAFGDPTAGRLPASGDAASSFALASLPASLAAFGPQPAASTPSGAAYAFGANQYGQLGDGTTTRRTSPTAVLNLTSGVTSLAGGAYLSLALTGGGQVYAFGNNQYGQLGSTTNNGTTNPNPTPTLVAGLSNVTAIAAGGYHSLALTGGGQVYAFGNNQAGQLGSTTNSGSTAANPTPTLVAEIARIK